MKLSFCSQEITAGKCDLPMNKHASSTIQALLYECITCREVLEDVLALHVIHLDYMTIEVGEQVVVEGQAQGRHNVCNVGIF